MLQIGISYVSHSVLFDHGANQTAFTLAEVFESLGHSVTFLSTVEEVLEYPFNRRSQSLYDAKGFDWLFDIDGLLSPEVRSTVAKQTIVFLRTFLQFTEMDRVVYIESPYVPRSMKGVHEIWCWDLLNPVESLPSIQTLFPCPIRRVPFIWSTALADHISQKKVAKSNGACTIHIAEHCINNTNSCILPLVAVRELHLNKVISAEYRVHGAEGIQENRFFKENILNNIEIDTLPVTFVKNEPFADWTDSILLSHSRFTPLRLSLLHALWAGVPLIHNSPILCDLHPVLKELFYMGNSIRGISAAITTFLSSYAQWYDAIPEIQAAITASFGIETKRTEWSTLCSTLSLGTPLASPAVSPSVDIKYVVAFSDMWPGFQPDSNVIIDALRHEYPTHTFCGTLYDTTHTTQLLIVGPFGTAWKSASAAVPKVFFTGENWPISEDSAFSLYLSSARKEDATHMRLPTWMTFIDWYSDSTELPADNESNPIRFPVALAMQPHSVSFSDRTRFCGFVVSNPSCIFRNRAFEAIYGYKPVDSGGSLYNNMGGPLSLKYPGGGSGDLSKYHFFSDRRFSISFENARSPGYITEKVLHAKMAGCVPLYWGDSCTDSDFVPQSFVNVSSVTDPAVLVKVIQKLEEHPEMCAKMAATPILDEEKKQKALATLSGISRRLMRLIQPVASWDKVFVINLDSRADRWKSLLEAEPSMATAERISAVDGRKLSLTPEMYQLFQHNTFQWKKSVMGCMLSHVSIWKKILQEKGDSFLILEDDVRFESGWREQWGRIDVPKDADLIYLGGILPPNRAGLPNVLQKITNYCYSIRPNCLFGSTPLPIFHLCAFSYVLTRSGAEKLVGYLTHSHQKLCTPYDHLIMHPSIGLTKYVVQPFLTRCFQEDDPAYCVSQFNDLQRTDTFDSDICNNNECFQKEELIIFQKRSITLYHFSNGTFDLYEREWLEDMLQVTIQYQPILTELPPHSWFLVQRPHIAACEALFLSLEKQNIPFHVLHLSDEFGMDSISFYGLSMCKTVIRNYPRALPRIPHLFVLPLGYHYRATDNKPWEERNLMWSFHGTDWFDRSKQLEPLLSVEPHSCRFQPDWNHSTMTPKEEYLSILGNSKFCPILRGNHAETFRLYEALEAGALPITTITDKGYLGWIEEHMGLSSLYPWTQPLLAIQQGQSESIRRTVCERWASWKKAIRITCAALL